MKYLFFILIMSFLFTNLVAQNNNFNGKEYSRLDVYKDNLLSHSQATNTTFKFKGKKMMVVEHDNTQRYTAKSVKKFKGYKVYDFGTFRVQRHDNFVIVENDKNEYGEPCNFERVYRFI